MHACSNGAWSASKQEPATKSDYFRLTLPIVVDSFPGLPAEFAFLDQLFQ
jgi:hypothetical protein